MSKLPLNLAYSEKLGRKIRQDDMEDLGISTQTKVEELIRAGQSEEAIELLDYMRLEYKIIHDFLVRWIQDLKTYIADKTGEESVMEAVRHTYEAGWKPRYQLWETMTPEEKLQLTVEGMRGHFSGPGRRGDVSIDEEKDRYVIRFDPCGSGQILRRGDPETGESPYPTDGVNKKAHDWTWNKTGVHWYCSHCCSVTEWMTMQDLGYPLRPVDYDHDPHKPCTWYIYKDPLQTPQAFYDRIGGRPAKMDSE